MGKVKRARVDVTRHTLVDVVLVLRIALLLLLVGIHCG